MGYPHRDRELEGTLKLHEFMREAQDLQGWLASQKQVAGRGESLGEDYEDILVRRGWGQGPAGLCVEGAYESYVLWAQCWGCAYMELTVKQGRQIIQTE